MPLYIRFENNKQVETGIHEVKPEGEGWYELPENLDQNKSYKLTEEGNVQKSVSNRKKSNKLI